jgi:hypothetical protein
MGPAVGLQGNRTVRFKLTKCICANESRFDLDLYARSFASEVHKYRVKVLDSNGNVMLYIGRMGNVDSGFPLVKDGKPPHPRSIGGDETAIMNALNIAVHSDKRLFISDIGNFCIRSVKLDYRVSERVKVGE